MFMCERVHDALGGEKLITYMLVRGFQADPGGVHDPGAASEEAPSGTSRRTAGAEAQELCVLPSVG